MAERGAANAPIPINYDITLVLIAYIEGISVTVCSMYATHFVFRVSLKSGDEAICRRILERIEREHYYLQFANLYGYIQYQPEIPFQSH